MKTTTWCICHGLITVCFTSRIGQEATGAGWMDNVLFWIFCQLTEEDKR